MGRPPDPSARSWGPGRQLGSGATLDDERERIVAAPEGLGAIGAGDAKNSVRDGCAQGILTPVWF